MDFIEHEFSLSPAYLLPGMKLSKDLEHRGTVWLKYGTELTDELISKIAEHGIERVSVRFDNANVPMLKNLLYGRGDEADADDLRKGFKLLLKLNLPVWAKPASLCRDTQIVPAVEEVIGHIHEIATHSRLVFELLYEAEFLTHPELKHCNLTMIYALIIGVELDFNIPALIELGICGMFYDIGKVKIDRAILNKPGKLTNLEFAQIKKHTFFTRQMTQELGRFFSTLPVVAMEHHENYYGGGYPRNLRGDDIHIFSQIVSLADKFSAMLTAKDYRQALAPQKAYEQIYLLTRSSVSSTVFRAFAKSVLLYPRNCYLKLSNGAVAVAVEAPMERPLHPVVELVYNETGEEYVGKRPRINLFEQKNITIEGIYRFAPSIGG